MDNVERIATGVLPPPASAPGLAPLAEKRTAVFGQKGALPSIASVSRPPAQAPPPREPTFQELKKNVEEKLAAQGQQPAIQPVKKEPTKEEMEQRAAYFKAQREKLLQQKQQERQNELEAFQKEHKLESPAKEAPTAKPTATSTEADAAREIRLNLARRFKEDLVHEAKKGQAASAK